MFRLAVVLGLIAYCAAHGGDAHCCSAEDRNIVQKQWKSLWTSSESSRVKMELGAKLLLKLGELQPTAAELLKAVNVENPDSPEFKAHAMRVLTGLDMFINLLKDQEALDAVLLTFSNRHANIAGMKAVYVKTFGQILGSALPQVLDEYDSRAWKACFTVVLNGFTAKLSN